MENTQAIMSTLLADLFSWLLLVGIGLALYSIIWYCLKRWFLTPWIKRKFANPLIEKSASNESHQEDKTRSD